MIVPAVASAYFSATPATAGGFFAPYQSGLAIGSAMAGCSARSDDAGFFFCNPATITGLDGATATIEARGYVPSICIEAKNATSPLGADLTSALAWRVAGLQETQPRELVSDDVDAASNCQSR